MLCFRPTRPDCGWKYRASREPAFKLAGTGGSTSRKSDRLGFGVSIRPGKQSATFEFCVDGARSDDLSAPKTALFSLPGAVLLPSPGSRLSPEEKRAAKNREKRCIPFFRAKGWVHFIGTESGKALARIVDFAGPP